jgi:hypothetical protein
VWLLAVCGAVLAGSLASAAGATARGWTTYYPLHQPVTVALPQSWSTEPLSHNQVLNVQDQKSDANINMFVDSPRGMSQSKYLASVIVNARAIYLQMDPKAVIRSRMVSLPCGRALEIIAQYTSGIGSRVSALWEQSYLIVRNGTRACSLRTASICPSSTSRLELSTSRSRAQTMASGEAENAPTPCWFGAHTCLPPQAVCARQALSGTCRHGRTWA